MRDDNNDYYKIRAIIPESNPFRDDIVARIFDDMLSGRLNRGELPTRIKTYVAEFNRLFPTKFAKFGDSQLLSLDECCSMTGRPPGATRSAAASGIRRAEVAPRGSANHRFDVGMPVGVRTRTWTKAPLAACPICAQETLAGFLRRSSVAPWRAHQLGHYGRGRCPMSRGATLRSAADQ